MSLALRLQNSPMSMSYLKEDRKAAIQETADNALAAFVIIHAAIKRSTHIKNYTSR